jgi:hypothetical protein
MDRLVRGGPERPEQLDQMGTPLNATEACLHGPRQPGPILSPSSLVNAGVIAEQIANGPAVVTASALITVSSLSSVRRSHMSWIGSPGAISPRKLLANP